MTGAEHNGDKLDVQTASLIMAEAVIVTEYYCQVPSINR